MEVDEEKKDFIFIWGGLTFPTEIKRLGNLEVQAGTSYPASKFSNGDKDRDKAITYLTIEDKTGKKATFLKAKEFYGKRNASGIVYEGNPEELIDALEAAIETLKQQLRLSYIERLTTYVEKLNTKNPKGLIRLFLRR